MIDFTFTVGESAAVRDAVEHRRSVESIEGASAFFDVGERPNDGPIEPPYVRAVRQSVAHPTVDMLEFDVAVEHIQQLLKAVEYRLNLGILPVELKAVHKKLVELMRATAFVHAFDGSWVVGEHNEEEWRLPDASDLDVDIPGSAGVCLFFVGDDVPASVRRYRSREDAVLRAIAMLRSGRLPLK